MIEMQTQDSKKRTGNLSKREVEVLRLGAEGATDGEISERLSISVPTLRTYWLRIRDKVGGVNRTHAIALALTGPLASGEDPGRRLLEKIRNDNVAEWVWRPSKRQVVLEESAQSLFGVAAEEKTLSLSRLLETVWIPDRPRFERFLVQSPEVGPFTPIDVRIGVNGDFRHTVRTVNLLTHRTKSDGLVVLLASAHGRNC